MKQTVILGNIITMGEKRPFTKAALVKDGVFAYIGSEDEPKKLGGVDAQIYTRIIKDFIAKNPQREVYMAAG